ncbi:MAG: HAMP domain-containing histidine kinase [Sporichthyaceae bacterium]|nr:HAMP domain-containing histidine kinase [Sporichthyaceae bacterium]
MADGPRGWPRSAKVVIAAVLLAGAACVAYWLRSVGGWTTADAVAVVVLAAGVALGELFQFELRYRTERVTYSITDALWTSALFLVRPSVLSLGLVVGVLVGQSVQAWDLVKVAFNAAQFVVGITAAIVVYGLFGSPPVTQPVGWLAAAAAMAAFQVVNTVLMAAIISLIEKEPFWRVALVPTGVLHWVGNLSVGILGALLWTVAPTGLPLLLVPLGVSFIAYRGWLRTIAERDAMREMAHGAESISRSGDFAARVTVPPDPADQDARQLAATLNLMLDRLEAAFERERQFIRESSHELRTPITICRGHLEILGPNPDPDELRETVELVLDELQRMGRIVDDMNLLVRMEDPASLRREPVQVDRLVEDVAAKATPLLNGHLRVSAAPGLDHTVDADSQRLTQALINLVNNAQRHTPDGTQVEIRVVDEPTNWRFEVADQGPGLQAADEATVFRPFITGRTRSPGNGLGLAIVSGIARAHGGSAGVDNRPGAGATFWVRVPR